MRFLLGVIGLGFLLTIGVAFVPPVRAELADSQAKVSKVHLRKSPALRFILTQTEEGRRLLDLMAPGLPLREQFEKAVERGWETDFFNKRFAFLAQMKFYYPTELTQAKASKLSPERLNQLWFAPLEPLDELALRNITRNYLAFQTREDGSLVFRPLPEGGIYSSEPVITRAQLTTPTEASVAPYELIEKDWEGWAKWARDPANSTIDLRTRSEKMIKEAKHYLSSQNLEFETGQFKGYTALRILPDQSSWLTKLAGGLDRCFGTATLYCPANLMEHGFLGAYNPHFNAFLIPHAGLSRTTADELTTHEILHVFLKDELNQKRINAFHGGIVITQTEGLSSSFPYATQYMSFEEIATYGQSLRKAGQALNAGVASELTLNKIYSHAENGLLSAEFAKTITTKALDAIRKNRRAILPPQVKIEVGIPLPAEIIFEANGLKYKVNIPLVLTSEEVGAIQKGTAEFTDIARTRLYAELPRRIDLYGALSKKYEPVLDWLFAEKFKTPEEVRILQRYAYEPRRATMSEIYERKKSPCLPRMVFPHVE